MLKLYKYSSIYYKLWAKLLLILLPFTLVQAQKPLSFSNNNYSQSSSNYSYSKDNSSIRSKIITLNKKGIFDRKSRQIGYTLRLENNIREEQTGEIALQVFNQSGILLYQQNAGFSMRKKGEFEKNYFFDASQFQSGYYLAKMSISSLRYSDSISYTFGFETSQTQNTASAPSQITAPSDFTNFWDQAKRELANLRADFKLTPRPDIRNKNFTTYEVEYKSTDNAIIYGWLTTPLNSKFNAVLYTISDYQSELFPEYRRDIAVLSINTRGTGSSNQNYNLAYDQLAVFNLKDKNKYFLRGIYQDALRGLDFITQYSNQLKFDTRKIVVIGAGLGASAAAVIGAIDSRVSGIVLEGPSFIGFNNLLSNRMSNQGFPSTMFTTYMNQNRVSKENIISTLEYFDPINFAPYINSRILIGFSLNNNNTPSQSVLNFINQLRVSKKDVFECKNCGNSLNSKFYGFKETWLKERFGQL